MTDKQKIMDAIDGYINMMVWESVQHSLEEKDWAKTMIEHSKNVISDMALEALVAEREND